MYLIRLDDASEYMDVENWNKMEQLLGKYKVKPIVGVIPDNRDLDFISKYSYDDFFWDKVRRWEHQGWCIAMHGYQHKFCSDEKGINPINKYSEFAGIKLEEQKKMLYKAYEIMMNNGIKPEIFFAPAHTFDENTIVALKEKTPIRIISDTIASDVYYENEIYYIPQQSGRVRKLPLRVVTFCYHPNNMISEDFEKLEQFIIKTKEEWVCDYRQILKKRKKNLLDKVLFHIYFGKKRYLNHGNI